MSVGKTGSHRLRDVAAPGKQRLKEPWSEEALLLILFHIWGPC